MQELTLGYENITYDVMLTCTLLTDMAINDLFCQNVSNCNFNFSYRGNILYICLVISRKFV